MSQWLMNSIFRKTSWILRLRQHAKLDQLLSVQSVQTHLIDDLIQHEKDQRKEFGWLHMDHTSKDVLEKAQARALGNLEAGNISAAEYFKLRTKIDDLKKIRFAENYDGYRVASDLGSTKERELIKLYEQIIKNERGELAHKLWKDRVELDPQAKGIIGNL